MATKQPNTFGVRRRFKGKMVSSSGKPRSDNAGPGVVCTYNAKGRISSRKPRGGASAPWSWECGQKVPIATVHMDGAFKVQLPRNVIRFVRPASI